MSFWVTGVQQSEGMDDPKICMACERFGILPARPAVDPTGSSADQADRLCNRHRRHVLEGRCILCGHAQTWASPFEDRSIACCRSCLFKFHGLNAARRIEEALTQEEGQGDLPDPDTGDWHLN